MKGQGMVRVRVKVPEIEGPLQILPSWGDLSVFVVAPDGREVPLTVKNILFSAVAGKEELTVWLGCCIDQIDIEARGLLSLLDEEGK